MIGYTNTYEFASNWHSELVTQLPFELKLTMPPTDRGERVSTLLPGQRKPVWVGFVSTLTDFRQNPPFSMESGSLHVWHTPDDLFIYEGMSEAEVEQRGATIGQVLTRAEEVLDTGNER